jgi:AGZA family xanthine/uracil permease-like MFS transporter
MALAGERRTGAKHAEMEMPVTTNPQHTLRPSPFRNAADALDRFFQFKQLGSNVRTEVLAGMTTFSTLSYILVVNPMIMAQSGMDHGALITATAVVGAIFTIMMGLWTNYPLAMAPGMGVNAVLAIQVCKGMGVPWQAALGLVFYSGVIFFIVSVTGLRKIVIDSFPEFYKKIISAGIGLFIAFLGLRQGGLLVANKNTFVSLGDFTSPIVLMGFFGIVLTAVAVHRKVPGALILSIIILTGLGLFIPAGATTVTPHPARLFDLPNSMAPLFLHLDLVYFWHHLGLCVPVILLIFFGDLFSAVACLLAIGNMAKLNDEHGNLPRLNKALLADSTAAMGGAFLGTNTPIIYIESAAGVEQGGRTGLVSIVVAIAYLLALFATPLIAIVPSVATTPALVIIGIFAAQSLGDLNLRDIVVATTAILTVLLMMLGSSSDGVAIGFIVCVVMMTLGGRGKELTLTAYMLVVVFAVRYIALKW